MRDDVGLERVGGEVLRVEAGARGVRAVDGERLEVILPVPGAAHQVQVGEEELAGADASARACVQGGVAGRRLAVEDRVDQPRGGDDRVEGVPPAGGSVDTSAVSRRHELRELGADRSRVRGGGGAAVVVVSTGGGGAGAFGGGGGDAEAAQAATERAREGPR